MIRKNKKKLIISFKKKKKKIKEIIVKKILKDEQMVEKEGEFFEINDFKKVIKKDCDVYYYVNENNRKKKVLLAKFRKKVIPLKFSKIALEELEETSKKKHDNRGAAGGALDKSKLLGYVNKDEMVKQSRYIRNINL